MAVTEIKDRIRAYRQAMDWTKVRLAEEAGISGSNVLTAMDRPDWNPTSKTLEALEAVIPEGWEPGEPIPANETKRAKRKERAA